MIRIPIVLSAVLLLAACKPAQPPPEPPKAEAPPASVPATVPTPAIDALTPQGWGPIRVGMREPTTVIALKSLERSGFVVRRKSDEDRRKVHVFLTAKGRALKRRLVPLAEEVNRVAVDGVPAGNLAVTRRTLLKLIANLARDD